jgi:hypothetical protein
LPGAKATVGTEDFIVEPTTNVKFLTSLNVPGGSSSLSLAGTGFREKNIAIISVKVYAAGLYVDATIKSYMGCMHICCNSPEVLVPNSDL